MDTTTRGTQKLPLPLVWSLLWFFVFLMPACFMSVVTLAVRRSPRPGLPPQTGDWHLPVLGAAVFASGLVVEEWQRRKGNKLRYKPKTILDPAAARKQRLTVNLIVGVPVLLMDCFSAFAFPNTQVDWPLLLLLNVGMAAGWRGLNWAQRLLPDPPGPDADPLAPNATPAVVQVSLPGPVIEISYVRRDRTGLPPAVAFTLTFLGISAMLLALSAAGLGRFAVALSPTGLGAYFVSLFLVTSLIMAGLDLLNRKNSAQRKAASDNATNATNAFISFLGIQVILRAMDGGMHQDWGRLIAIDAGAVAALLFVRWVATLPVVFRAPVPAGAGPEWLPKFGVARRTPTEVVLQASLAGRLFVGGFSVFMAGLAVTSTVLAFPSLIDSRSHSSFSFGMTAVPLVCAVLCALFSYLFLSGAGPRDLRLGLDTRTYTWVAWKPWPGMLGREGAGAPFNVQRLSGPMDVDIAGVGLYETRQSGTTYYLLKMIWKDATRSPQMLRGFREAEEARAAMLAASAALGLPALGRCE